MPYERANMKNGTPVLSFSMHGSRHTSSQCEYWYFDRRKPLSTSCIIAPSTSSDIKSGNTSRSRKSGRAASLPSTKSLTFVKVFSFLFPHVFLKSVSVLNVLRTCFQTRFISFLPQARNLKSILAVFSLLPRPLCFCQQERLSHASTSRYSRSKAATIELQWLVVEIV